MIHCDISLLVHFSAFSLVVCCWHLRFRFSRISDLIMTGYSFSTLLHFLLCRVDSQAEFCIYFVSVSIASSMSLGLFNEMFRFILSSTFYLKYSQSVVLLTFLGGKFLVVLSPIQCANNSQIYPPQRRSQVETVYWPISWFVGTKMIQLHFL